MCDVNFISNNKKANQPEYALIATDESNRSAFGDVSRTIVGWYRNKQDISKETEEIYDALCKKQNSYTIKYAVAVNQKWSKIEIAE